MVRWQFYFRFRTKGLPESLDEKKEIIHRLLEIADEEGLSRDSLIIDGLVATVGANRMAALETLDTIAYCKNELQIPTICGLSIFRSACRSESM